MGRRGPRSRLPKLQRARPAAHRHATTLPQGGIAVSATGYYITDVLPSARVQKFDLAGNFIWVSPANDAAPGTGDGQVSCCQALPGKSHPNGCIWPQVKSAVHLLLVLTLLLCLAFLLLQFQAPQGVAVATNLLINGSVVQEAVYVVSRRPGHGVSGAL